MTLPEGWQSTGLTEESGQAWVYQVHRRGDTSDSRFALKRLKNPDRRQRFAREVAAMDRLRREHAVAVPDVIEQDLPAQRPWFVMPWYDGGSLERAVSDGRYRTNLVGGLAALIELAEIIADVHAAEVAHRDLKPSNVLFGPSGLVLADFGLCLELDEDVSRLTDVDEAVGSRLYIAPENEAGINDDIDQRPADTYAFGKLTWAILVGRQPLPREAVLGPEHRLATLLGEPRLAALDGLLRDLLNRDPRARIDDWNTVTRELRAVESGMKGIPDTAVAAASERAVAIARRIPQLPQVDAAIEASEARRQHDAWWRQALHAMRDMSRIVEPAIQPLARELGDLLTFVVTTGGAPTADQLAGSDHSQVVKMTSEVPEDTDATEAAVCFSIHSPRGVQAFPTLLVRVWLSTQGEGVWINRVPMVCPVGGGETVATFLADAVAARFGPFPPFRHATVEEALAIVEATAAMFLSLSEHYLDIVDRGEDPGNPAAWQGREIVQAAITSADGSPRGDTQPPDLLSLEILPSVVELHDVAVAVTCRARIVDDAVGVAGEGYTSSPSQARFRSPSGQTLDALFDHRNRLSGDARDGVYEGRVELSPESERGLWKIESVLVVDQLGNARRYSPEELRDRGMPNGLQVR